MVGVDRPVYALCTVMLHWTMYNKLYICDKRVCQNDSKISLFRVTGLNILSRVGTHFFYYFFLKNTIYAFLKAILPFKIYKITFLSRKPGKL